MCRSVDGCLLDVFFGASCCTYNCQPFHLLRAQFTPFEEIVFYVGLMFGPVGV